MDASRRSMGLGARVSRDALARRAAWRTEPADVGRGTSAAGRGRELQALPDHRAQRRDPGAGSAVSPACAAGSVYGPSIGAQPTGPLRQSEVSARAAIVGALRQARRRAGLSVSA